MLKFRYEKLRNFCSKCGMLTHDAFECPQGNNAPLPPPAVDDDDDDPDYGPDGPDGNLPDETEEPMNRTAATKEEEGGN